MLRRADGLTAYGVRQVFLTSLSAEWSGSAGAVYPAIRRLQRARLLHSTATRDGRGTHKLVLSPAGIAACDRWLCDAVTAMGPGTDPFRTRAGMWRLLPKPEQRRLHAALEAESKKARAAVHAARAGGDAADEVSIELHLALLEMRLRWLKRQ